MFALAVVRRAAGARGRPRKDWLPFDDARSITRALGLRGVQEWRLYRRQNKHSMARIPANPDVVYRMSGYVDFYDWLNYERHRPRPVISGEHSKPVSIHLNFEGAHLIQQIIDAHVSSAGESERLELFAMPSESRFTFLYRKATGTTSNRSNNNINKEPLEVDDSDWVPLSLRVSAGTSRVQFGPTPRCSDHPLVCVDLHGNRLFVLPPGFGQFKYPFSPSRANQAKFGVSIEELPAVLQTWWESDSAAAMKKSRDRWALESIEHQRSRQWMDYVLRMKKILYEPLGLCLAFSQNSKLTPYNSFLSGIPVIHQLLQRKECGGFLADLDKRSQTNLPFAQRTKIGFAIFGVRKADSPDIAGVFCFPGKTLLEHGILGSEQNIGRPTFSVFPPFCEPRAFAYRCKKSQDAMAWQPEFYIDLSESTPDKLHLAREKLRTILSRDSTGTLAIN